MDKHTHMSTMMPLAPKIVPPWKKNSTGTLAAKERARSAFKRAHADAFSASDGLDPRQVAREKLREVVAPVPSELRNAGQCQTLSDDDVKKLLAELKIAAGDGPRLEAALKQLGRVGMDDLRLRRTEAGRVVGALSRRKSDSHALQAASAAAQRLVTRWRQEVAKDREIAACRAEALERLLWEDVNTETDVQDAGAGYAGEVHLARVATLQSALAADARLLRRVFDEPLPAEKILAAIHET